MYTFTQPRSLRFNTQIRLEPLVNPLKPGNVPIQNSSQKSEQKSQKENCKSLESPQYNWNTNDFNILFSPSNENSPGRSPGNTIEKIKSKSKLFLRLKRSRLFKSSRDLNSGEGIELNELRDYNVKMKEWKTEELEVKVNKEIPEEWDVIVDEIVDEILDCYSHSSNKDKSKESPELKSLGSVPQFVPTPKTNSPTSPTLSRLFTRFSQKSLEIDDLETRLATGIIKTRKVYEDSGDIVYIETKSREPPKRKLLLSRHK